MVDLITFGEAMVRLSPPDFQRVEQARSLDVNVGGAELNVAVGVTRFGMKSAWISKLPKNGLGYLIRNRAQESGVDCSHIIWSEQGRAGLYFVEFGAALALQVYSMTEQAQRSVRFNPEKSSGNRPLGSQALPCEWNYSGPE